MQIAYRLVFVCLCVKCMRSICIYCVELLLSPISSETSTVLVTIANIQQNANITLTKHLFAHACLCTYVNTSILIVHSAVPFYCIPSLENRTIINTRQICFHVMTDNNPCLCMYYDFIVCTLYLVYSALLHMRYGHQIMRKLRGETIGP